MSSPSFDLHNFVYGTKKNDTLKGTTKNDMILGYAGNDLIYGGAGRDLLIGHEGNDTLYGEDGDDILQGHQGRDFLYGGNGNDALYSAGGTTRMEGGAGNDTYYVDSTDDVVVESSAQHGIDTVFSTVNFTLGKHVEHLTLTNISNDSGAVIVTHINGTGNELDNVIKGTSGNNQLSGLAGNDRLEGGAGNDTLLGGAGNDTLIGGSGIDRLVGGAGNDTYYVDHVSDVVVEKAGEGSDTIISTIHYDLSKSANVEHLTLGGSGHLNGTGSAGANLLTGNAGNNKLYGLGGNDTIDGGAGNDTIYGGYGNDRLITQAGDRDVFVFEVTNQGSLKNVSAGKDVIVNFDLQRDSLDFYIDLGKGSWNQSVNYALKYTYDGQNWDGLLTVTGKGSFAGTIAEITLDNVSFGNGTTTPPPLDIDVFVLVNGQTTQLF